MVFILLWGFFLIHLFFSPFKLKIPQELGTFRFYVSEMGDDLRFIFAHHLRSASKSLSITTFGLTDDDSIALLEEEASRGISVTISYDKAHNGSLPLSPSGILYEPLEGKGLMHRKAVVVDEERVLFGSANLTLSSLSLHRNFLVSIKSPTLAHAFKENLLLEERLFTYFPLPEAGEKALETLLSTLSSSKKEIHIALFTLTHPAIIKALIAASSRGVKVHLYIDRTMANGASKEAIKELKIAGVEISSNRGAELLHHKCALIDDHFFLGSANWTKAAFSKNEDYLLHFHNLSTQELAWLHSFFIEMRRTLLLPKLPLLASNVLICGAPSFL